MEYDVLRMDRRITQAYKKWYESRGTTTVSWRQSIAEWMLQQTGYTNSGLPSAPPRQKAGRPQVSLSHAPVIIKADGTIKTAKELADEAAIADFDRRKAEAHAKLPKLNGARPKRSKEWTISEMMDNEFTREQWDNKFCPEGCSLEQYIKDLNYVMNVVEAEEADA